jgi:hypothetical protein
MYRDRIVCIFCGNAADIVKEGKLIVIACSHCKRETELDAYKDMFQQWIDDIRNDEKCKRYAFS